MLEEAVRLKPMQFYDVDQYSRLRRAALARSKETYLMVLLAADAGLRLGEIVALEWGDIDLQARRLTVRRSDWCGHVKAPKNGVLVVSR